MNKNIMGGLLILGIIVLLFAGVFLFRDGMPGGLYFSLQFEEAKGLKPGDFVYMRGISIGEIKDVRIQGGAIVAEVKIYPKNEAHVPDNSFFFIWPDQLLTGKQCVIVEPGDSVEGVERGELLRGESSKPKIIFRLGPKKLEEALGTVRTYLEQG